VSNNLMHLKNHILCEFFYPNLYLYSPEIFNTTIYKLSSNVEKEVIIDFGKKIIDNNNSLIENEICKFELMCNKFYFSNLEYKEKRYIYSLNFYRKEVANILFSINYDITILSFIDINYQIQHLEVSDAFKIPTSEEDIDEMAKTFGIITYEKISTYRYNIFNCVKNKKNNIINLQWHITDRCENNCSHCYIQDENKLLGERRDTITLKDAKKIIDELYLYSLRMKAPARIVISGGDPLLSPFFWDLLEYANCDKMYPMIMGILGNPNLINEKTAKKLKENNIETYQMSLEGLKDINDEIRGKGNWDSVWNAIEILEDNGINTNIMFTVSRKNYRELIPLINYCANIEKTNFSFARYCPTGKSDILETLSPKEYRNLLLRVVEAFRYWRQEKKSIVQWDLSKDALYAALFEEMGINFYQEKTGCCLLGNGKSLALLPDGLILYCRRMPKSIGFWPDISFEDALLNQKKYSYIEIQNNSCKNCSVSASCRGGCKAVNFRICGINDNKDAQCWR